MINWDKVVDAFVSAGLSKEEANKVVGRGYSAIYSPWVEYDGLVKLSR
jgi:transposase